MPGLSLPQQRQRSADRMDRSPTALYLRQISLPAFASPRAVCRALPIRGTCSSATLPSASHRVDPLAWGSLVSALQHRQHRQRNATVSPALGLTSSQANASRTIASISDSVSIVCSSSDSSSCRAASASTSRLLPFPTPALPPRLGCKARRRGPLVVSSVAPLSTLAPPPESSAGDGGNKKPTRRLILMRHADSTYPPNVRDHDRPISEAGKQQAEEIASVLIERGWVPDMVLASNAIRTRQTLDAMGQVMESIRDVDTHLYGSLYTVAALDGQTRDHIEECLLEVVDDDQTFCVAVVGHNKGMEQAASSFAGKEVRLETASVALLQCSASSWKDVLMAAACRPPASRSDGPSTHPREAAAAAAAGPSAPAAAAQQGSAAGGKMQPSQGQGQGQGQRQRQGLSAAGLKAGSGCWSLIDVVTPKTPGS